MDNIYSNILIEAKNQISGKELIDNKSIFDVKQVIGAGLHHIITIIFDETCADIKQMQKIKNRISEILRKLSMQNKIDISIISINESCIKLKSDFQEYADNIFDYQSSPKGMSPILSAVYVAYLRNMKLKELYDNDSEKECTAPIIIVISDFFDNDNRYNKITNDTINGMLNQINNTNNMEIIKIIMKCQHPNTKEHFSQNLFGNSFYVKENEPENVLYWIEKTLYRTMAAYDNNDDADNPFDYNIETSINNIQKISEFNYKNESIYIFSDNQPVMPIIFVIDASLSMKKYADDIVNYFESIFLPNMGFIDFAVMIIHNSKIKIIRNFSSEKPMFDTINAQIRNFFNDSKGSSPLIFSLNIAYKKLIQRIEQYKEANLPYISPMLVIISDFLSNDFSKTNYFSGIADMFEIIQILSNDKNIKTIKVKLGYSGELSQKWHDAIGGFFPDIHLNDFIIKSYAENTNKVQKDKKFVNDLDVDKLLEEVTLN